MKKYSFYLASVLWLLCSEAVVALAQNTTDMSVAVASDESPVKKKKPSSGAHQLRFGFDISKPVFNALYKSRNSYEFTGDYNVNDNIYVAAEAGWGNANVDFPDLRYKSNNIFFKAGIDKSLFAKTEPGDWDVVLMGVRYGAGIINRKEAAYTIVDDLWGIQSGTVPAKTFMAHWFEITGGIRVEVVPHIALGWNVRARFLMNQDILKDLTPAYIAGYGKGDKGNNFDFNFYVCYGFPWYTRGKAKPLADSSSE